MVITLSLVASSASPATPAPESAEMVRDQLVFSSHEPDHVVALLVLQRTRAGAGASLELKALSASPEGWAPPTWVKTRLPRWPGEELGATLRAWSRATASGASPLGALEPRVEATTSATSLSLSVRDRSGRLSLEASHLVAAGGGSDPHGPVTWRTGEGLLIVSGKELRGLVVVEHLGGGARAWPSFGAFEMWIVRPAGGGLLLGRHGGAAAPATPPAPFGEALWLPPTGPPEPRAFRTQTLATRPDAASGFALPIHWRLEAATYRRVGGELSRGQAPSGGPQLYDLSAAREVDGEGVALVLHLEDGGGEPHLPPSAPRE